MTITFDFAALHYLNLWLSKERAIHELVVAEHRDEQLLGLFRGGSHFKVARTLETKYDAKNDKRRYEPVLEIIGGLRRADLDADLTGTIQRARDKISAQYGGTDVLSATTKFLWLRFQAPVIIYDSQVREALGTDDADLSAYVQAWQSRYDQVRTSIANASSRLTQVLSYAIDTTVATESYVQQLASEDWFNQRIFDVYLWHSGGK